MLERKINHIIQTFKYKDLKIKKMGKYYKILFKENAIPIKKIGKYSYWYYKENFVVTKHCYKNRDSTKEKIMAILEKNDIIGVMFKNFTTFRGLNKIRRVGLEENGFENI